ncbi:unnamed protein product [Rotaria magnacalcarata]
MAINDFQSNLIQTFHRSLTFLRTYTSSNQLIVAANTAFSVYLYNYTGELLAVTGDQILLTEQEDLGQINFAEFVQENNSQLISDWYVACWSVESLLLSSLTTFYNQSVLDHIVNTTKFSALHFSNSNHFNLSTVIDNIMSKLFIEEWTSNISYSLYYHLCKPLTCFYQVEKHRNNFLISLITLIGLLGGLSIMLRSSIPLVTRFIFYLVRRRRAARQSAIAHLELPWTKKRVLSTIIRILVNLNLFKTAKRVQVRDLNQQRWSTHLFIILLCAAILIITAYNSINKISRTIVVNNPSLDSIEKWQADSYITSSLQCPCSQISAPYQSFFHLTVTYHQICSSDFISSRWIASLQNATDPLAVLFIANLRSHPDFFELLRSLCTFANNTISSALAGFSNTQLVTAALLVRQVFDHQMNSVADFFIQSTISDFLRLIYILSNLTQVNQFITEAYSSFDVELANVSSHLSSQFLQNTTIYILLEHMFLEVWAINSLFERYFNACAVQSCSYMILENYVAIEIITILFGLIGGISNALIFTVPFCHASFLRYRPISSSP